MKKNVLFVVDERKMGGVSILLSDILNKINVSNYNIDVLVLHNNGEYLNDLPKSVNILYGTDFFNTVDYTLKEVLESKSIRKIFSKIRLILLMKKRRIEKRIVNERKKILKKRYDVEIAFKDGFCALFTAYGDSKKKYHWLHIDYDKYDCTSKYSKLFKEIVPKFDKIIAISKNVLESFSKKYSFKDSEVIYNIIDEKKIKKLSEEENIKYDDKLNLVVLGRLHRVKGYDRLIDVIKKLDEEKIFNNSVLRIIGNGEEYQFLKDKIKSNKLEEKVFLLGQKKNPYPYVKASDLFIMCSHSEGFGNVIIESFILGVPVLSLEIKSINEIMDNKYGIVFPNSFDGLYNGIKYILENKKVIREFKNNLQKYHYDIEKIILKIEKLIDE